MCRGREGGDGGTLIERLRIGHFFFVAIQVLKRSEIFSVVISIDDEFMAEDGQGKERV